MLRGRDLTEAEQWLAQATAKEPKPTAIQTQYIFASRQAATTRQRVTLGAVTFGLVVAIVLAGVALYQRQIAERQRQIAVARQLAAQAELTRTQRAYLLPRSVLLAVEAMRRSPSLAADQVLRHGLELLATPVAHMAHDKAVLAVSFSPDDQWLATRGLDNYVRVWEAATGKEVARLAHEDFVFAVAFSPNGQWVATASDDRTARVWPWRPEDLIAEACGRLPRNLTVDEWRQYLGDEPYRKTCPNLP